MFSIAMFLIVNTVLVVELEIFPLVMVHIPVVVVVQANGEPPAVIPAVTTAPETNAPLESRTVTVVAARQPVVFLYDLLVNPPTAMVGTTVAAAVSEV